MKKLLLSLVAALVLIQGGVSYATQDEGQTGANTKRSNGSALGYVPYKELQLVRWGENGPSPTNGNLSAGDVVVWDCVSDDGVTIALVGSTNSSDAVAGVVVSTVIQSADSVGTTASIDYGRRNWGYIQVRGYNTNVNMVGTAPAAGAAIRASDTARNAEASGTSGGSLKGRVIGFAYDNSTDSEVGLYL